jgi:hypothetical protein
MVFGSSQVVHVPKIMTASRVQHQHVEELVEVPIPMTQEQRDGIQKIRAPFFLGKKSR